MTVRLIKKSWWVDFHVNKVRHRKRSPQNSRAAALAYEAVLRGRHARGEPLEPEEKKRDQPFAEFARRWFDDYVVVNNKYSEQRTKRYLLSATLIPFFGKLMMGSITTRHIEEYKARQLKTGASAKTINNRLTVLSKCLATAYEWLELEGSPPMIKWLKSRPPTMDFLSTEEIVLLLSAAEGALYDLVLTALRTGMRQGELRGLQWSSIDWESGVLTVRHSRCDYRKVLESPKSNRERYIPLDREVYDVLFRRREKDGYVFVDDDGEPFDRKRMQRRMRGLCKKVSLRRIGWHTLRHTFASHLAMNGVPLNTVQALLGHSSISTTMRYAHVAPSALREAIALINPPQSGFWATGGQPVVIGPSSRIGHSASIFQK